MLRVTDLVVRYGPATALSGVNLEVARGEMVALVGPNGAGKSTFVNALSGLVPHAAGQIEILGPLAHVPEGRQLLAELTVEDNLRLGAWTSHNRDPRRVYDILPKLESMAQRRAGTLSGGEQQMVAFGRALMADPEILAIDELSLGLAPVIVNDLARHLVELNQDRGTAVLLIEQNARLALELCSRTYVLDSGHIVAHGLSRELAEDPAILRAYLGDFSGAKMEGPR